MNDLRINLIQTDVSWEDSPGNLRHLSQLADKITEPADVIVLAEMFNTGFSMHPERCAEPVNGPAMKFMARIAHEKNCLVTGSILTREKDQYYNRLIAMKPDGSHDHYDKRHLFSISGEDKAMTAGSSRIIVSWKGWNILPLICYDLRFPVWSRNHYANRKYEYDLLVYPSNWPKSRVHAFRSLLVARAIENLCFVAGVNRIGEDSEGTVHSGESMIIDPRGTIIVQGEAGKSGIISASLPAEELRKFRESFNTGPDWDRFSIQL
jgi:omega-amidase